MSQLLHSLSLRRHRNPQSVPLSPTSPNITTSLTPCPSPSITLPEQKASQPLSPDPPTKQTSIQPSASNTPPDQACLQSSPSHVPLNQTLLQSSNNPSIQARLHSLLSNSPPDQTYVQPMNITFQITVCQLTLVSKLSKKDVDIRVAIRIGNVCKMTCSGNLSEDGLTGTWNHSFLFTASPSADVEITVWLISEEVTPEWNREQLGNDVKVNVKGLLKSSNGWQSGAHKGFANLTMSCMVSNVLTQAEGHDCMPTLRKYCTALHRFRQQLQNVSAISTQTALWEALLDILPEGHNPGLLHNLVGSHMALYRLQGQVSDLGRAIELGQTTLDRFPNHPGYLSALGNLAISLTMQYWREHNLADLDKAMELRERRLELCPLGHQDHAIALENLAYSLRDYYKVAKAPSDLMRAIKLLKEALESYHPQDSHYAYVVKGLAETILLPFSSSQEHHHSTQLFPHAGEAFDAYQSLKKCLPTVSADLWNAAQSWIKDAEKHAHSSLFLAYHTSLDILDHSISMQFSPGSRQVIQASVTDLLDDMLPCAVQGEKLPIAVELFDQGQGILWNQLVHFDISLAMLEKQGDIEKGLWDEFMQLSRDLNAYASKGIELYRQAKQQWESAVEEIRLQNGFSHFLSPPLFADLQKAAEDGPVIILNASKHSCNALIVFHAQQPVHIPLDCSLDDFTRLCSSWSKFIGDPLMYGKDRESWVKQFLRELWSKIVRPIVTVLRSRVDVGSRIWWCPVSRFAILPLHAAGTYRKGKENLIMDLSSSSSTPSLSGLLRAATTHRKPESKEDLMDLYVSSYTPSLSVLIRARQRASGQKQTLTVSEGANKISCVVVGQAQPSVDENMEREMERKIQSIRDETNVPQDVFEIKTIAGEATTIEGTIQAFKEHRWVHLTCPSEQNASEPAESSFGMNDGPLTLARIIKEHYVQSEFAFLTGCHTTVGDESGLDKMLHLAIGMQLSSGFNGVVGPLWKVDSPMAPEIVTRFYKEMFGRSPDIDIKYAAEALKIAVKESANVVPLEKRIMYVHIGI